MQTIKIQEALDIAKANPNGDFANSLRATIESGSIDKVAFEQGVDLTKYGRPAYKPETPDVTGNVFKRGVDQIKDIPQDIQKTGQNIAQSFKSGMERIGKAQDKTISGEQSLASGTFQTIGEGLRTGANIIGDLFIGGASLATTPAEEQAIQDKLVQGVQALGKTDVGQGVAELADQYNSFKETNPEIAANLEASLGFAEAVLEVTGAGAGLKGAKKGLNKAGDAIGEGIEQAGKAIPDIKVPKLPELNKDKRTIDKIVGEITQEKDPKKLKSNIEVLNKVVNDIEVGKDITVSDLRSQIKAKQQSLVKGVDDALSIDTTPYKADQLTKVTKGKTGDIVSRPVEDALAQLDEIYRATGDDVGLDEINFIKNKLDTEGLTRKEVNDLARLYGKDVSKGFTKLGQPTTSVTGQATENTRKKLKSVVREGLDDTAKELDSLYGKTVTLDKSLEKFDKAVQNLTNKTVERGVIENLTNQGSKLANLMSGGALKGAISGLLQSNIGGKTMNALALQEALAKNLKQLQKLNKIDKVKDVAKKADIINDVAKTLLKEKGFSIIDDTFLDTDKIVKDLGKRIKDTPNQQGGFVKTGLGLDNDLVTQAKKFDNVDDFIKSQDIVYHGTNKDFDKFDSSFIGSNTSNETNSLGTWFSTDKNVAKTFGDIGSGKTNIKEVVLDIKNPKIYNTESIKNIKNDSIDILKSKRDSLDRKFDLDEIKNIEFKIKELSNKPKDTFDLLMRDRDKYVNYGDKNISWKDNMKPLSSSDLSNQKFINKLKEEGYDSIIIKDTIFDSVDGKKHDQIVVFDTNSIKTKKELKDIWEKANK